MECCLCYRQGDILIAGVDGVPWGACPVAREAGRIVLAQSGSDGYAHTIDEPDVEMYEKDGRCFIRVPRVAIVRHERYHPVSLARGTYRIAQ